VSILSEILTITPVVQTGAVSTVGFGSILAMGADSTLNSQPYLAYTSAAAVTADEALGYLTATHAAYLRAIFAARKVPTTVYAGRWNATGLDLPAVGLQVAQNAMLAAGLPAPYWIGINTRGAADILSAIGWLTADAYPHTGIFQQADADSITTGYPPAFSTVQTNTQKVLIYAAASGAKYLDADCLGFQASTDPRVIATGGHWYLGGQVGDALTDAQRGFARTNAIATGSPLPGATSGGQPVREYELRTVGGANPFPLYLRVTVDYVVDLIRTSIASAVADVIASGERFPGSTEGAAVLTGLIGGPCSQVTGTGAGAWLSPTDVFQGRGWDLSLTWNPTTRRFSGLLRVNVRGQIAGIDLTALFGAYLPE
jgi:hypothetical protein